MKRGLANGKPRPTRSSAKVEVSDAGMADRDISNLEQFKYSARGREQDATRGKDDETISTPHSKDNFDGKGKAVKSVPIKGKRGQVVRKTPAKEAKSDNGSSSTAAEVGEGGDEGVTKGTDAVSTSEDIDLWAVLQSQGSKGTLDSFSVAAKGLPKGGKARASGLEIRTLADILPIPSHESVGRALRLLGRGEVHAAKAVLSHDSVESTAAFCKQWFKTYKLPVPAMLQPADVSELSPGAVQRIRDSSKRNRALPCRLTVEKSEKMPDLEGSEFENGAALALVLGQEASYSMIVVTEEEWCTAKAMRSRLEAEEHHVDGCVLLTATSGDLSELAVTFHPDADSVSAPGLDCEPCADRTHAKQDVADLEPRARGRVRRSAEIEAEEVLFRWLVSERSPKADLRPAVLVVGITRRLLRHLQPDSPIVEISDSSVKPEDGNVVMHIESSAELKTAAGGARSKGRQEELGEEKVKMRTRGGGGELGAGITRASVRRGEAPASGARQVAQSVVLQTQTAILPADSASGCGSKGSVHASSTAAAEAQDTVNEDQMEAEDGESGRRVGREPEYALLAGRRSGAGGGGGGGQGRQALVSAVQQSIRYLPSCARGSCAVSGADIRRGFPGLCGQAPLLEACAALLEGEGQGERDSVRASGQVTEGGRVRTGGKEGGKGTQALVWALFMSAFEDVAPFRVLRDPVGNDRKPKTNGNDSGVRSGRKRRRGGEGGRGGGTAEGGGSGGARGGGRKRTKGVGTRKRDELRESEHDEDKDEDLGQGGEDGKQEEECPPLAIAELIGLAAVTRADSTLRLPSALALRVVRTALLLQACSETLPWRGWTHLKDKVDLRLSSARCQSLASDDTTQGAPHRHPGDPDPVSQPVVDLTPWGGGGDTGSALAAGGVSKGAEGQGGNEDGEGKEEEDMLDALRVGALALATQAEAEVLLVYLRAAPLWPPLLKPLSMSLDTRSALQAWPSTECVRTREEQDERLQGLNEEARIASHDPSVLPNLLLFIQAGLTSPPRNLRQHSLPGLSRAFTKLCSGLNLRQDLPLVLERVAAFRGREEARAAAVSESSGTRNSERAEEAAREYWSGGDLVAQGGELSPHEAQLIALCLAWARHLRSELRVPPPQPPVRRVLERERGTGGAGPRSYEARAAFLMLFGETHHLKLAGGLSVAATVAGVKGREVLVQRLGADEQGLEKREADGSEDYRGGAEAVAVFGFVQDEKVRSAAEDALITKLQGSGTGAEGTLVPLRPPPFGFQWREWLYKDGYARSLPDSHGGWGAQVRIRIERARESRPDNGSGGTQGGLRFLVEGRDVASMDASALLEPCGAPTELYALRPREALLIRQAFYALGEDEQPPFAHPPDLLLALQRMAAQQREGGAVRESKVPEWVPLVSDGKSALSAQVWRDSLLAISTRDGDTVEVGAVTKDGNAARQAVRPLSEGSLLRILFALEALYPSVLDRCGALRWRVSPCGSAFVHLYSSLEILARHSSASTVSTSSISWQQAASDSEKEGDGEGGDVPRVKTELWPHQRDACARVMEGVREGKLGFADASAVGAGKTFSALATVCAVAEHLAKGGKRRHGSLVLVPVNELVREWVLQASQHCSGLHVIEQRCTGKLFSLQYQRANPPIDGNCLVISTLARVRDHPFAKAAWDFVVIDECLSVQNDSALQTAEAWRQVEASQCGVLMLSATFFRSSYQKLFYMIRMLRSPLPREQPFLTTTLVEHIVCYVPKNRRKWKLSYEGVALDKAASIGYASILTAFQRKLPAEQDHRRLYVTLKQFLAQHYEPSVCIDALAKTAARLSSKGRRPLLFANTDKELSRLVKAVPGLRRWGEQGPGPLAVTVHAAAQGLNLQHEADCVVCRPQPGDRLEQMKGRIDRPGQPRDELELVVVLAANTVEEAEAANIRLCGTFFRHYISPHSREFELHAIDASFSSGKIQAAFRKRLLAPSLDAADDAAPGYKKRKGRDTEEAEESDQEDGQGREKEEKRADKGSDSASAVGSPSPKKGNGKGATAAPWVKADRSLLGKARKLGHDLSKEGPRVLDRKELEEAAVHLCAVDPKLRILIRRIGVSCVPTREASTKELSNRGAFLALVKGVVFQMISVSCGNAIMDRMIEACGGPNGFTPEAYLAHSDEAMCGGVNKNGDKNVGLSRSKHGFIKGIAEEFVSGRLSLSMLEGLSDHELCHRLCAIKGIGEWTAGVFMLHFLNRPDVMLYGDLTVRMGLRDLYNLSARLERRAPVETHLADAEDFPDTRASRDIIDSVAEKWRPYRTVVNHLIWHYKENPDSFYVV